MSKIKETEYSSGSGVIGDETLEDADELEMDNVAIQTKSSANQRFTSFSNSSTVSKRRNKL